MMFMKIIFTTQMTKVKPRHYYIGETIEDTSLLEIET